VNAKTDPTSSTDATSRKERRAAERSARKSGSASPGTPRSSGPSMLLISVAAIVIGLVAIVALVAVSGGFADEARAGVSEPDVPAPAQDLRVGRSLGDPEAPVKIEVFEDPQCPACGLYTEQIEPLLVAGPVTRGEVFLTYKDLPFLGPESLDAAVAMRVAEELGGKFWDYHQVVFHNQDGENQGAFSLDRLADMAELVGLDRAAFLAEMEDPSHLEDVKAEAAEAAVLQITSTPSLVVNGEVLRGVPDWDALSQRIEAGLSGTTEAG
jgi:protein-disulfide isomerase